VRDLLAAGAQARELVRVARAGARAHDAGVLRVARRARRLRARDGYEYAEALRQGLLDPRLDAAAVARNVSRHRMLQIQHAVNPEALGPLSGEKDVFCRYFAALGIPVPELYGVLGTGLGWRRGGGPLERPNDLAELLASGLPEDLVVKPVAGFQGEAVHVLRRDAIDPAALLAELRADPRFSDWLIQERLVNHPEVAALTGSETLQCVRIVTLVERSGDVTVLYADFRLALAGGAADNFRGGRSGNGLASVGVEDGVLGPMRLPRPDACGFRALPSVPGGRRVEGVALPHWPQALALARRAAIPMLPARTIGWDVALTPGGPVVLEANMFYWPSSASDQGAAARRIAEG
jgi:hypothetical protein